MQHKDSRSRRGRRRTRRNLVLVSILTTLTACSSHAPKPIKPLPDVVDRNDATTPRREPLCRNGNPDSYDVFGKRYHRLRTSAGYREQGIASWYGPNFHGRRTSCGEVYDMYQMTAAHKLLPLPTYCEVTNLDNGRRTIVKVNDRGPFHGDRIIDLSYAAAQRLGIVQMGTARVEVRALDDGVPFAPGDVQYAALARDPTPETKRDTPMITNLSPSAADRLAEEVKVEPPVNPLEASNRFDEEAEPRAALALRASDRGTQVLSPAPGATPLDSRPLPKPEASAAPEVEPARPEDMLHARGTRPDDGVLLQVGAFTERGNAERLRSRLLDLIGEQVSIRESAANHGLLYRVHIGPLRNDAVAGRVRNALYQLGLPNRVIMN